MPMRKGPADDRCQLMRKPIYRVVDRVIWDAAVLSETPLPNEWAAVLNLKLIAGM